MSDPARLRLTLAEWTLSTVLPPSANASSHACRSGRLAANCPNTRQGVLTMLAARAGPLSVPVMPIANCDEPR